MNDLLRVTVLGSCRVDDPFRLLAEEGKVELDNAGVYGYVHYAKEAVQQLRVMRGELEIPLRLKPFITHREMRPGAKEDVPMAINDLSGTDLLVIEVSSLKEIEFRGYFLQINRLREKLVGEDEQLAEWWATLYKAKHGGVEDETLLRGSGLGEVERELVAEMRVALQGAESLHRDMAAVHGLFDGPVLWVSHFDTRTLQGAEIPIRKELVAALESGAALLGQSFYNPRALLEEFGLERGLVDMAHYKPEFEPVLAADLYRLLSSRWLEARAHPRAS